MIYDLVLHSINTGSETEQRSNSIVTREPKEQGHDLMFGEIPLCPQNIAYLVPSRSCEICGQPLPSIYDPRGGVAHTVLSDVRMSWISTWVALPG